MSEDTASAGGTRTEGGGRRGRVKRPERRGTTHTYAMVYELALRASVGLASESSTQNPLKFIFRALSTLPTAASLGGRRATYGPAHDPHTPLPWTHASWSPRLPSSRALSSW